MAIEFAWTTTVIVAIVAGGAALLATIILTIFLTLRFRKKRLSGRLLNARLQRMSRYPGGNLSITSSEFGQLPSLRNARQRPFSRGPYGVLGWSRVGGSRDTLTRMSSHTDNSRPTLAESYSDLCHTGSGISWPLQPPAVRTRGLAGGSMSALPLSSIDEGFHQSMIHTPITANSSQQVRVDDSHIISYRNDTPFPRHPSPIMNTGRSFPTHRRSVSTGFIELATSGINRKVGAENSCYGPQDAAIYKPMFRRTLSLHSQHSGNVPTFRPESPPPGIPRRSRVMALRSHPTHSSSRSSVASSTSISSSKCDDGMLLPYPIKTEIASISMAFGSSKRGPVLLGSHKLWDPNKQSATAMPYSDLSTSANNIHNHATHQGFRFEINQQQPLSRSASSGLSCSLVDRFGPSRNTSNASRFDLANQDLSVDADPDVPSPLRYNGGTNRLLLQKLESRGGTGAGPDCSKRASMSILQDISGNKNSAISEDIQRPSSLPTSQPFKWDGGVEIGPGKSSAMKPRSEGHKRQSRQRISFVPSRPGSRLFATTLEESEEEETVTANTSGQNVSSPRPPSLATFQPQIEIITTTPQEEGQTNGRNYSATMSMYNIYTTDQNSSTEHLDWTPTRKPSAERAHSRFSRVMSNTDTIGQRPLPVPSTKKATPGLRDSVRLLPPDDTYFTSFEGKFPQPPKQQPKQRPPEWRLPATRPIRGPRAPPFSRSPTRRSPQRSSPLRPSTRSPSKLAPDIKTHVMRLRRMNSEISDTDAVAKQFLNMGSEGNSLQDTPEGSVTGDGEVFELVKPREKGDEKEVELGNLGRRLMEKARRESVGKKEGGIGLGIEVEGWPPRAGWLNT